MCKLGFKEAEEPEIKLPVCLESWRKQRSSKEEICFINYAKAYCVVQNKLWKILKEMGVPDHLTCLWEIWYAKDKEQQLESDMELTG